MIEKRSPYPRITRCAATNRAGKPCRSVPLRGSTLCMSHDPAYADTQRANVRKGGVASGAARRTKPIELHFNLDTPRGIRDAIRQVIHLQLAGKLPSDRARDVIRALDLASQQTQIARHNLVARNLLGPLQRR